jgi:hypothetical protein
VSRHTYKATACHGALDAVRNAVVEKTTTEIKINKPKKGVRGGARSTLQAFDTELTLVPQPGQHTAAAHSGDRRRLYGVVCVNVVAVRVGHVDKRLSLAREAVAHDVASE